MTYSYVCVSEVKCVKCSLRWTEESRYAVFGDRVVTEGTTWIVLSVDIVDIVRGWKVEHIIIHAFGFSCKNKKNYKGLSKVTIF